MSRNSFKDLLKNAGFHSFLWTQFLGAFNDNVYKILVSMRAVHVAGKDYVALSLAVFVVPFLLFSGYSGHLADAFSKRRVLISVKVFEIFVMGLGLAVFFSDRIELMLVVLFLMALHSTIFSPAKYGIVPEMLPDKDLSRANGLLEMSTFVAIVLGTSIGVFMFDAWKGEPWKMGVVMLAVSVAGFLASLKITKVPASGTTEHFKMDPFAEVWVGTKHLVKDKPLWLTVIAISYFWFLGALFQSDLLFFGSEVLKVKDLQIGLMVTCLAIGIGVGSMLAGRLSGNKVELGLVPLGAILMSGFCVVLYMSRGSYVASVISLAFLGCASGIFIVPLNAYLQQRSESTEKGRIIATNNFYNTVGLLAASGILWIFHDKLHVGPATLLLVFGGVTVIGALYIVSVVPEFLVRFVLWLTTHTLFKIRIVGQENVPFRGPALLVANHMSHIDGFLINACIQRFIRFMVWKPFYEMKAIHWFFKLGKAIPVGTSGPRDMLASIRAARKELEEGHVVCIFAEGAISRTGNMLPFRRGLEKIVDGLDVPVIPVHLDRLWGSIFSFERGRFLWKRPKRIPYPVTVSFGNPMPSTSSAAEVRQAIQELASDAAEYSKSAGNLLDLRFVRTAKKNWRRFAMADSSGRELTYGHALTASLLFARWVRRNRPMDSMIGLLLPSSVAGALANTGVMLAGNVPVNLNFTAGREAMACAVEQCGIRTIITSKVFLAKAKIEAMDGMVYVEDILASASGFEKFRALVAARALPARCLAARRKRTTDSLATIIFSSGSSGVPKGVMLSHHNILSNIQSIAQLFWVNDQDVIVGVLPFFHSFGYTVTIWLPLVAGCSAAYHTNPTEASKIGELVAKYRGTMLVATPTFYSGYTRKCTAEQFASLRFTLVGAEKLRLSIAQAFQEKFGLDLLEGYGCTEMSPVVAVNGPNFEAGKDTQLGNKPGTVGHPVPGVAVKIVNLSTLEPLAPNEEGLVLVKGPNRMLGYLNQAERTAEALKDGWYVTGDIGALDDEGFLRITDRLARFSKIGGEMVPHLKVEESIYAIIGRDGDYRCAVTGIPDDHRGERLVALYTRPDLTPGELWRQLSETDLPKLWLPKRENFYFVEALPTLGTGKLDLVGMKARAQRLAAASSVSS